MHLVRYALGDRFESVESHPTMEQISRGGIFFPRAPDSFIEEVSEWNVPTMAIAGSALLSAEDRPRTLDRFYRGGMGALWQLPEAGEPVLFPPLQLPGNRSRAILIDGQDQRRRIFRQLFHWNGMDVRSDIHSTEELIRTLEQADGGTTGLPEKRGILVVDLDQDWIEPGVLVEGLRRLFRQDSSFQKRWHLILMKDFAKPGPVLTSLAERLRNHVRRVFHPHEALMACYEGLYLKELSGTWQETKARSLDELILGRNPGLEPGTYRQFLPPWRIPVGQAAKASLFAWIMEFLEDGKLQNGVILSPPGERG